MRLFLRRSDRCLIRSRKFRIFLVRTLHFLSQWPFSVFFVRDRVLGCLSRPPLAMVKIDIRAIEVIGEDGVARDEPVMLELQV